jgi:ferredoxin
MQITLEGHERPVPAQAGDTVLAALLRAGLPFPFSCQFGNCGTCKCELVSGQVLQLEYSEQALSAAERARGIVLACRSQVSHDVVIRRIDT